MIDRSGDRCQQKKKKKDKEKITSSPEIRVKFFKNTKKNSSFKTEVANV